MPAIRSILWIGCAEQFPASSVAELPTLDVVWERRVDGTAGLSLAAFDALVVDLAETEEALAALRALRRRRACPPVLVGVLLSGAGLFRRNHGHRRGSLSTKPRIT